MTWRFFSQVRIQLSCIEWQESDASGITFDWHTEMRTQLGRSLFVSMCQMLSILRRGKQPTARLQSQQRHGPRKYPDSHTFIVITTMQVSADRRWLICRHYEGCGALSRETDSLPFLDVQHARTAFQEFPFVSQEKRAQSAQTRIKLDVTFWSETRSGLHTSTLWVMRSRLQYSQCQRSEIQSSKLMAIDRRTEFWRLTEASFLFSVASFTVWWVEDSMRPKLDMPWRWPVT